MTEECITRAISSAVEVPNVPCFICIDLALSPDQSEAVMDMLGKGYMADMSELLDSADQVIYVRSISVEEHAQEEQLSRGEDAPMHRRAREGARPPIWETRATATKVDMKNDSPTTV